MRYTKPITCLALATLLAGCAHAPAPTAPSAKLVSNNAASAAKLDAQGRANQFAGMVDPQFAGKVTVVGAVVTLTSTKGNSTVTYDFSSAPQTGMVTVTSGDFTTTISNDKLLETYSQPGTHKILPALVVEIAIHVAIGGAKGLAYYWFTHRDNFNRDEAIRATVIGMGDALMDYVPYGKYFEWLVPFAVDILAKVVHGDFKEAAELAMKDLNRLVEIIKRILGAAALEQAAHPTAVAKP